MDNRKLGVMWYTHAYNRFRLCHTTRRCLDFSRQKNATQWFIKVCLKALEDLEKDSPSYRASSRLREILKTGRSQLYKTIFEPGNRHTGDTRPTQDSNRDEQLNRLEKLIEERQREYGR